MADINTVLAKIYDSANEAHLVAGTPNIQDQVVALQAQVNTLSTQVAAQNTKIANALAALTA